MSAADSSSGRWSYLRWIPCGLVFFIAGHLVSDSYFSTSLLPSTWGSSVQGATAASSLKAASADVSAAAAGRAIVASGLSRPADNGLSPASSIQSASGREGVDAKSSVDTASTGSSNANAASAVTSFAAAGNDGRPDRTSVSGSISATEAGATSASSASNEAGCSHPTSCDGACGELLKLIRKKRDSSTWKVYYDEIADFLLERKATRVVEIGTAWGGLAKRLLERMPSLELHCVDPFMAGYDKADLQSKLYEQFMQQFKLSPDDFSKTYAQAMSYEQGTFNHFGCRYVLHHKKSTEAAPEFAPASVDGVFIDGLHTYEGVVEDIAAWKGIAKPQGVLMFNDYGNGPFPGVKKAVQEYASSSVGLDAITHIGVKKHGNVYIEVPGATGGLISASSSAASPESTKGIVGTSDSSSIVAATAPASSAASCNHPTSCGGACGKLLKLIRQKRDSSTWKVYYDEVADFLLERKAKRVVEIGTAWGGLAKRLLERMPNLELHCIDPFMAGYDKADLQSKLYEQIMQQFKLSPEAFSKTYAQAMAYEQGTHNRFGCRYVLHHKKSTEATTDFDKASVDGIFIDGLHTYEGVVDDIAAWKGIAKPLGVLMFNDYGVGPFPGVKKAVQEYASSTVGLKAIKHIGVKKHGNVYIQVPAVAAVQLDVDIRTKVETRSDSIATTEIPPAPGSSASNTPVCNHPSSCDGACGELLKLIRQKRDSSTWKVYYDEIADFLLERKATRVVEIGTAWGGLAKRLLERMPNLQLHCVDPFMAGYDKADLQSRLYEQIMKDFKLSLDEFSNTYAQAMSYEQGTFNGFGCRYVLHHKKSTETAPEFAPASVDGVFIDGLHTYEGVVEDIAAWKGIAKPQGVLMFNDYGNGPFPGVKKAAQEYASSTVGLDAIKHIGMKQHGNVYIEVPGSAATVPSSSSKIASNPAGTDKACNHPTSCEGSCGEMLSSIQDQLSRASPSDDELVEFLVGRKTARVVEVGTDCGRVTKRLLERIPSLELHCVEPLKLRLSSLKSDSLELRAQAIAYDQGTNNGFGCRFAVHPRISSEAAAEFAPSSVDAVIIDGTRTYAGVLEDIELWQAKPKSGGVLVFDEYGNDAYPGVQKAVEEYALSQGGVEAVQKIGAQRAQMVYVQVP